MRRHRSNIWLPPLLLVVCGALSWLIYREFMLEPSTEAAAKGLTAVPTTLPALPPEPQFSMLPIEDFQAILERPIFSPSRRPPSAESIDSVELPATTGDVSFVLKGILIDEDERTALFRSKDSDKLVRLGEGDKIEGWTLVRIEADQVVFASGEIERVLQPTFDPPAPSRRKKRSQKNKQQQDQKQVDQSNSEQVSTPE